jgi:hypothetical protein
MTNEKQQYPKELITYEKVSEDSEETTKIITVVNNDYEEKAVKVAIKWMSAYNKHDVRACEENINFPLIRLGLKGMIIFKKPPLLPPRFFERFTKATGWNRTCWEYRNIIHSCKTKVHLSLEHSRYRADGTKIDTCPAIWVITNQDGHWGIKMRSSFVT